MISFVKKSKAMQPFKEIPYTVIDSRNWGDEICSIIQQSAKECDYCVMKTDYSTFGQPAKFHSKDDRDAKYIALKYIATYACIYNWTVSFWKKVDDTFEVSNYLFRLHPSEKTIVNGKNREYLQKMGMDLNLHVLYGLRYYPGLKEHGRVGIQGLFTQIIGILGSSDTPKIFTYNGTNEIACLFNDLFIELPESFQTWLTDLSYFKISDIKEYIHSNLGVSHRNHLLRLYAVYCETNFQQIEEKQLKVDFQWHQTENQIENRFGFNAPHIRKNNGLLRTEPLNNDSHVFNPFNSRILGQCDETTAKKVSNFYLKFAGAVLPYATGESNEINISAYDEFKESGKLGLFQNSWQAAEVYNRDNLKLSENQTKRLLTAAELDIASYVNITENIENSAYR
eukprot:NODE_590_length_5625_cov_0.852515.p1 type:complete len:396 gc:universal NODE_590_length_5625_cov_0.852515:2821-1634(-)